MGPMLQHALILAAGAAVVSAQTRPEFKVAPEVPAMPKALMKLPRTDITRAKFPAVDFHLHGSSLKPAVDYQKMIALMDKTGIPVICNIHAAFHPASDPTIKADDPFTDPLIHSPP